MTKTEIGDLDENACLSLIPNFGIWNPSIREAAEIVVVDMWFSGAIESVKEPEDFDGNTNAPWLKAALAETITTFEARLSAAIDSGKLKASAKRLSLDDRLIPEETYVNYEELVLWMNERQLESGEHMDDWCDTEMKISELISDEVAFLREVAKTDNRGINRIQQQRTGAKLGLLDEVQDVDSLQAAIRKKNAEIVRLKNQLARPQSDKPSKTDRPLATRQRRTLLTIIAALCNRASIDYQGRGTALRIKESTELIGTPIGDDTIRKLLDEIPDALETRMK